MEKRIKRKLGAIFSADLNGCNRLRGNDKIGTIPTLEKYRTPMDELSENIVVELWTHQ